MDDGHIKPNAILTLSICVKLSSTPGPSTTYFEISCDLTRILTMSEVNDNKVRGISYIAVMEAKKTMAVAQNHLSLGLGLARMQDQDDPDVANSYTTRTKIYLC